MNRPKDGSVSYRPSKIGPPDVTQMQGYAARVSAAPGDEVPFEMTTGAQSYRVAFRRLGETGGVIGELKDVPGRTQACPEQAWETGCGWETDFFWVVPEGCRSGIYAAECVDANGATFHVTFVVTPRLDRKGEVAVLASTNTWNAYNGWGGMSAYTKPCPRGLSLDRPMPVATPVGTGRSHLVRAELWVLDWLERAGYGVDVYSEMDLHRGGEWLRGYRALIINTHGEYWSGPMRDHLDAYLSAGGSLLYLSGNGVYWKVTYDPTGRVMEVRKEGGPHHQTGEPGGLWRSVGRPEHATLGVGYVRPGYMTFAPYMVEDASHWVFKGAGVKNGDLIGREGINGGAASGWETDQADERSPKNLRMLARGLNPEDYMGSGKSAQYPDPACRWDGRGGAHITYYDHPGGGGVFAVGSIAFGGSLVGDPALQRVVRNVLDRFLKR